MWHNTVFASGDPIKEIKWLKEKEGKNMILIGSARLANTLILSGIVDEYQLWIHPVILGNGKPIFYELQERMNLKLKDSVSFESGVVANSYSKVQLSKLPPDGRGQRLPG